MKAYKTPYMETTQIQHNKCVQGETIEQKLERIVNNKEPINGVDSAPIIYTERKEGVRASTNIRTDRFEIAVEAADKIAKSYKAKREENAATKEPKKQENDGGAKPIEGTAETINK